MRCGSFGVADSCRWAKVSRLHVDQSVTLSLDAVPESIPCRVHDVQGAVSRLAYRDELPPKAIGALVLGSAGYVVFDEFRAPVGLRVSVRANPPYLDVAITDGVSMPERRGGERVKLFTRAQILFPDESERPPEWTYTVDVSESGVLLRHHPAFDEHERFTLGLMFGDDPRPILVHAAIVRRTEGAVGVAFEPGSRADSTRLSEYLMGIRHQRRTASQS
jgi:hypothetical protein